jgi:hypothetical protein
MTRTEASILANYMGAAFYIPDARAGLVGDYVCLIHRGDKPEDEGERVGPYRFLVKWDAVKFRSLMNETYHQALNGELPGKFYHSKFYVVYVPDGTCAHCGEGKEVFHPYRSEEAKECAAALNLALKLGREAVPH